MVGVAQAQPCNRPQDPKKVVLMISFHDGSEEEKGARQAACARGETLVVVPKASAEAQRIRSQYDAIMRRAAPLEAQYERCNGNSTCEERLQAQYEQIEAQARPLQERLETMKPDYEGQLSAFLESSRANGAKVSSLIVSGHDGGGHYYGDYGETDISEISAMVAENQGAFADTSTLLLMGCWTAPPDQVEQYRAIFPKMRVLGGFVGSAPASTRIAAGTYVSGLLRGERNLPRQANRASVQAMINSVQHLNMVTSGVYVNPVCDEEGRSPAYYFVSPANSTDEIPNGMRPGLNNYDTGSNSSLACMRLFGGEGVRGTFDWNAVTQFFQGNVEPDGNAQLRSLYSTIRNNQSCLNEEGITSPFTGDQVLFLRFFQDTKKNFEKYFRNDLETMYQTLDGLVAASVDPAVKTAYEQHKKLKGKDLLSLTRSQTLQQISALQGVYDRLYQNRQEPTPQDDQVRRTFQNIDKHLYRLKCMNATWHEYAEGETLAAPTC